MVLWRGRGQRGLLPASGHATARGAPGAGHRWAARGALGRCCVLGSIGGAGTGGADIAAYAGGMQDGGGGAASQSQGPVWLLGAFGGRASVRGQEASGRGEALPRRSSGKHCPGHWLGVPGGRCAGVLRRVQVAGLGHGLGPLVRRRPPGARSSHIPHHVGGGTRGTEEAGGPGQTRTQSVHVLAQSPGPRPGLRRGSCAHTARRCLHSRGSAGGAAVGERGALDGPEEGPEGGAHGQDAGTSWQ
ncbi:Hypothetical protein GL50581_62 [Giardia duodenalis ATCC 50581]|uniref:Uncharacterized protein n=1 Tax=Giardia intestinalis (strain ATCC 50581 / GS clone H7) TaxID=598745 RepID=C6LMW4_GIAIB|nr:Hypothetical protein GL50581_62 [Giardia intestinalis ATCC 50581]